MPGCKSMKISALESYFQAGPTQVLQRQWEKIPPPPGPKA